MSYAACQAGHITKSAVEVAEIAGVGSIAALPAAFLLVGALGGARLSGATAAAYLQTRLDDPVRLALRAGTGKKLAPTAQQGRSRIKSWKYAALVDHVLFPPFHVRV